jgi:exopolyphosphatase/guanosine-5'-triphosphate,3'-diphosphate pyrophosphatase
MTIASIDIGTNTVLLLIAEVNKKLQIKSILDEYRIPRIGKGLFPDGQISEDRIKELILVLNEYKELIKTYECQRIIVTATNAMRIATNRNQIVARIKDQFGWDANIVSGKEEASLSFLGAVSGYSGYSTKMVIDIGGGSTEFMESTLKLNLLKVSQLVWLSAQKNTLRMIPQHRINWKVCGSIYRKY